MIEAVKKKLPEICMLMPTPEVTTNNVRLRITTFIMIETLTNVNY